MIDDKKEHKRRLDNARTLRYRRRHPERMKKFAKERWQRHGVKESVKASKHMAKYRKNNKEKIKQWEKVNEDRIKQWHKDAERKRKFMVMEKYGGTCIACGCSELAILTIDHINDDGAIDRRRVKATKQRFYSFLMRNPRRSDLQVLCHNCQWKKRIYGPNISEWPNKRREAEKAIEELKKQLATVPSKPGQSRLPSGFSVRFWNGRE